MARQGSGLAESIIFACGVAALVYASGVYKSVPKEDTSAPQEFVLDNGQKCHVDKNSQVLCTDAKGAYQPVPVSFPKSGTMQPEPPPKQ